MHDPLGKTIRRVLAFSMGLGLLLGGLPAAAQEKASVRLKWLPQAQFAGIYMAKEKGFYLAEGIDMTINPGGPNISAEALVAAGTDQFAQGGGVDSQVTSRAKNLPLVTIGIMHQKTPFVFISHADSGIKAVKDFKGKKVSVWFTGAQFVLYSMLAQNGLAQSDVTIQPQQVALTPFLDRQVDVVAATLYNEMNTIKARKVSVNIIAAEDSGITMPRDPLMTSEKVIQERPKLVQGFVNATLRGWKYAFQNKKETVDVLLRIAPTLDRAHQEAMLVSAEEVTLAGAGKSQGIGYIDMPAVEKAHKVLLDNKAIDSPIDLSKAFDDRFWKAAPDADKKM
ncbi:MAG: ABC transporter substrate-binding protein [Hyphomicrobiaceae bacterium]